MNRPNDNKDIKDMKGQKDTKDTKSLTVRSSKGTKSHKNPVDTIKSPNTSDSSLSVNVPRSVRPSHVVVTTPGHNPDNLPAVKGPPPKKPDRPYEYSTPSQMAAAGRSFFGDLELKIMRFVPYQSRPLLRVMMSELLGTFILSTLLHGSFLMGTLPFSGEGEDMGQKPNILPAIVSIMLAIYFACLVSMPVSGGHINPAVTIAYAITGRLSWLRVLPYIISQLVGGFLGAVLFYFMYYSNIQNSNSDVDQQINFFFETDMADTKQSFFHTFLASFFLLFTMGGLQQIMSHAPYPLWIWPIATCIIYSTSMTAFCHTRIPTMNPAIDLGGRLFLVVAKGSTVFKGSLWFTIGILAPIVGGIIGLMTYRLLIGDFFLAQVPPIAALTEDGFFHEMEEMVQRMIPLKNRPLLRVMSSEAIGTFILSTLMHGCVLMGYFPEEKGQVPILFPCIIGIVCAVYFALLVSMPVSGGHINPAVTLAFMITGRFDLIRVIPYILSQLFGGFTGAFLFYTMYMTNVLDSTTFPDHFNKLNIMITKSEDTSSTDHHFKDSFWASFFMLFSLTALIQIKSRLPYPRLIWPLATSVMWGSSMTAFCYKRIPNMNPAIDFGARMFLIFPFKVSDVFDANWFTIGLAAPISGAIAGHVTYRLMLGSFFTDLELGPK